MYGGQCAFTTPSLPKRPLHFILHHMVRKHRIWAGKSSLTVSWVLRAAVTSASTHSPEVRIAPPKLSAALAAWTFLRCPQLSFQPPPSSPLPLVWALCWAEACAVTIVAIVPQVPLCTEGLPTPCFVSCMRGRLTSLSTFKHKTLL